MIGKLAGRVDYVAEDHALIDTGGVGYVVFCAPATLARLAPGEGAALYTDLVVREDLLQLFGFASLAERDWHRLLTSVQGVGARVSLGILGALGADGIARAIALEDATAVRRAPGVGPKLAARIVNELKGKAPDSQGRRVAGSAAPTAAPAPPPADAPAPPPVAAVTPPLNGPEGSAEATADALSALQNLGYERAEALRAVHEARDEVPEASVPALIRAALRRLAPPQS
ncbi:MAG: Holliday junction branch migration protein RuvA [Pseudomonadota bacterium]